MEISALAAASGRAQIAQNFLIFLCILPLCNLHKKNRSKGSGKGRALTSSSSSDLLAVSLGAVNGGEWGELNSHSVPVFKSAFGRGFDSHANAIPLFG
jgi:hypothetical protein